jgi:UDP-N-acetylmuramoyl-L-alanyl-D-glutamate--2,6-diaminopimelate ligase
MKHFSEYLNVFRPLVKNADAKDDPVIQGITCDSRKVKPGFMFVAIAGAQNDGHKFIDTAVANGAAAIVHARKLGGKYPETATVQVADPYYAYALACECYFKFPASKMRLHGITGTNGKTTTAYILEHILRLSKIPCGLISTIEYRVDDVVEAASRTTPEAYKLHELFYKMRSHGCTDAVMEVSSHGLDQHRPGNVKFYNTIFTNLTGDHLDYHRDMESYYQAKKKLFFEYMDPDGFRIINTDDPYGAKLVGEFTRGKVIKFGKTSDCFCQIGKIMCDAAGSLFSLRIDRCHIDIRTNLIGEHNVYNITAAVCAAIASGVMPEKIVEALEQNITVPGRLEHFRDSKGVSYFVDYAHTDDALRNVLSILRKIAPERLITVFGCGGDRDRSKRPRMGEAAAELSDLIILTSDNPRSEEPMVIMQEIMRGVPDDFHMLIEPDRKGAIELAQIEAKSGDIVLIAGKGHETYQEQNGEFTDFDDREVVRHLCNL